MPKRAETDDREDAMDDEEALFAEGDEECEDEDEEARAEDDEEDAEDGDPDEESEDEEEPDDEEEDDEPPPSSKGARAKARRASTAAPRSLAQLAGLPDGASHPAIATALYPLVSLAQHVMAVTGAPTPSRAKGAFQAIVEDAAKAGGLQSKLHVERKRNNRRERMALLRRLQKADIHPRGELFVDVVDEVSGKRTVKAAPIWAEMKLSTLRQYVTTKLEGAAPRRPPAVPEGDPTASGGAAVTAEDRRIAEKNGWDPKDVAASRAALFPRGGSNR